MGNKGPCRLQLFQPERFVYGQSTSFDLEGVTWFVLFCAVSSVGRVLACMPYLERQRGSAQGFVGEMEEVMGGIAGLKICLDVGLAW